MRFPWLQVDADFISAHAGDLGAHLGISRREAMGLALDLWTWALARARDDAPPDGIVTGTGAVPDRLLAGSVGWIGPAEQFAEAIVAVGLAVRIDGGYRLTGFGRYKATWEKNRRRSGRKPEGNRSGTGEEPARKTQTQKEEDLAAQVSPSPEAPAGQQSLMDVAPAAEKPKPKRPTTPVAQWAEEANERRKVLIPPDAPQELGLKQGQWPVLGEALKAHGALTLTSAFTLFLADAYARERNFPVGLFVGQVARWVGEAQAQAARARVGGGDKPRLGPRIEAPAATFNPDKPRL